MECALAPAKCFLRNREKYPFWQNYAYERVLPSTILYFGTVAKFMRNALTTPYTKAHNRR